MTRCPQCGQDNPGEANFCSNCGSRLVAAPSPTPPRPGESTTTLAAIPALDPERGGEEGDLSPADLAAVDALRPGTALLVVRRGPNAGSRFLLDADLTTAGRHRDSAIFLDDVTVSRRHAEFQRVGQGFVVRDVGSLNGTYVNRDRIDEAPLSGGDEVQVGKYRLMFFSGPTAEGGT